MIITPEYVKEHIDNLTDIDLTIKSRKREIVYMRMVAFKLCRDITKASLQSIGDAYQRDHSTVLHNIRQYDIHENQQYFKRYREFYMKVLNTFSDVIELDYDVKRLQTISEIKRDYQEKFNKMTSLYRSIIKKQKKIIDSYEYDPMYMQIAELPKLKHDELKERVYAYLRMNAKELLINKI